MSFGFCIGDFITAGQLAYQLWSECKAASSEYTELAELCHDVSIAVNACRPNDPYTILRRQHVETIALLAADCHTTLQRLQALLGKYQNMGTVQNIGKKLGFVNAKEERKSIQSRLQEHFAAINTFLSGVQMETLGLTVKLLLKMLEGQNGGRKIDAQLIADDSDRLQDLFKEFSLENEVPKDNLEKNTSAIKDKLKEAVFDDSAPLTVLDGSAPEQRTSPAGLSEQKTLSGPARPSTAPYDPMAIDWFTTGKGLFALTVQAASTYYYKPDPPVIRYSRNDEWLCKLPEGWSITPTLVTRDQKTEEGYYYVFNNLLSSRGNELRTSRAYCYSNPFYSGADKPLSGGPLGIPQQPLPAARFFWQTAGAANLFSGQQARGYAGFVLRAIPLDLGDDLSRELAYITTANNGRQQNYSNELIEKGLPDHWTWDPDDSGNGHHIYINSETGDESTVHPARFHIPDDDGPTTLPPGWERRLDGWGNLFFVDHNTQRAVREDPRSNTKIDQRTGLPQGWNRIRDHSGQPYFYNVLGKMVLGTYSASFMNEKSVKGKAILSRVPKNGEDPHTLDMRSRPRDRLPDSKKAKAAEKRIRRMTKNEKQHYYELFATAPKKSPLFITLDEALEHCKAFKVPSPVVRDILFQADSDRDRKWDCDEYAAALHAIRVTMEKNFHESRKSVPTQDERRAYYAMFECAKSADALVMTLDEVIDMCKAFALPKDLVEGIWARADANWDRHYDPNEFAVGMHQIMKEVERREGTSLTSHNQAVMSQLPAGTQEQTADKLEALRMNVVNPSMSPSETSGSFGDKQTQPMGSGDLSAEFTGMNITGVEATSNALLHDIANHDQQEAQPEVKSTSESTNGGKTARLLSAKPSV